MSLTVLIMTDGLRPDALELVHTPNIAALRARASSKLAAQSLLPNITLPCHMSIFHSVEPARHGIVTNRWQPMARPVSGLVENASKAGKRCYFFYNWEPLRDLSRPEHLRLSFFCDNARTEDGDQVVAGEAVRHIGRDAPDFAFVYFGNIDEAGHCHGWMADGYLRQIERTDVAIGMVLDAIGDQGTVLLQSDHGGHDRTHGTDIPEDMTIVWMIAGPGIRREYTVQAQVNLLDTAPTLARVLGVAADSLWEGHCIDEVFEN